MIGLLVGVVPQFSQMFADMGKALPLPTQIVVGIGNVLTHYWWAMLAAIFLGIAFASKHFARPEVKGAGTGGCCTGPCWVI